MDQKTTVRDLKDKVKEFCDRRDWDQFHNAKELAIGIVTEASELLECFRFKSYSEVDALFEDKERSKELKDEIADVFYFLLRLAQRYDIDLSEELERKIEKNNKRYPVEKSKGSNKKYSEF